MSDIPFPYIERPADRKLRECLGNGESCYVKGPFRSGKTSLLTTAQSYLKDEFPNTELVIISLKSARDSLREMMGEGDICLYWYVKFCTTMEELLNLAGDKRSKEILRADGRAKYRSNPDQMLTDYIAVILEATEDKKLVIAFEDIDILFEFAEGFSLEVDGSDIFLKRFFNSLYMIFQVNSTSPDRHLKRYKDISLLLTGSRHITELPAASRISAIRNFSQIILEDFSLSALQGNSKLKEWGEPHKIREQGFERVHAKTNGYPFITIGLLEEIASQDGHLSLDEAIETLNAEWESSFHFSQKVIARTPELAELYKCVLNDEQEIIFDGSDSLHRELQDLGLVAVRSKKLVVHNEIFRSICLSWGCIENRSHKFSATQLTPDVDSGLAESIPTDISTITGDEVPNAYNVLTPAENDLNNTGQRRITGGDRPASQETDNDESKVPWLALTINAVATSFGIIVTLLFVDGTGSVIVIASIVIMALIGLLLTTTPLANRGALKEVGRRTRKFVKRKWGQTKERVSHFFSQLRRRKLKKILCWASLSCVVVFLVVGPTKAIEKNVTLADTAFQSFEDGREIDAIRDAIRAGNGLQGVERVQKWIPWFQLQRVEQVRKWVPWLQQDQHTSPRLVLQYIYSNINQLDEFKEVKFKSFYQTAFSTDGKTAAVASKKHGNQTERAGDYLVIWSNGDVNEPVAFRTYQGVIKDFSFNSSGEYLVTSGEDGTVKIWKYQDLIAQDVTVMDRNAYDEIPKKSNGLAVNSVKFSPNDKYLATLDSSGALNIWNFSTDLRVEDEALINMPLNNKPRTKPLPASRLAVGNKCIGSITPAPEKSEVIRIWDVSEEDFDDTNPSAVSGAAKSVSKLDSTLLSNFFNELQYTPMSLSMSKDNKYLVFGGTTSDGKGFISYYQNPSKTSKSCFPNTEELLNEVSDNTRKLDYLGPVASVAINETGNTLFIADKNGAFEVDAIEMSTNGNLTLRQLVSRKSDERFSSSQIETYHEDPKIFMVSVKSKDSFSKWTSDSSRKTLMTTKISDILKSDAARTVIRSKPSSSDSEKTIAILTQNGLISTFDDSFNWKGNIFDDSTLNDIALNDTEEQIAGITNNGKIILFDWDGKKEDTLFDVKIEKPQYIKFIPNSAGIVAVSSLYKVRFYDSRNGEPRGGSINSPNNEIKNFEVSSDGQYLLLQGDSSIQIFDISKLSNTNDGTQLTDGYPNKLLPKKNAPYKDAKFYPKMIKDSIIFTTIDATNDKKRLTFWRIEPKSDSLSIDNPVSVVEIGSLDSQELKESKFDSTQEIYNKFLDEKTPWEKLAFYNNNRDYLAISTQESLLAWDLTNIDWASNRLSEDIRDRLVYVVKANSDTLQTFGYTQNPVMIGISKNGNAIRGEIGSLDTALDWGCSWLKVHYHKRYPDDQKAICP
jgi:hypothetical protein